MNTYTHTHTSNQDAVTSDDLAGFVYIDLRTIPANQVHDEWYPLIVRPSVARLQRPRLSLSMNQTKPQARVHLIIHKEVHADGIITSPRSEDDYGELLDAVMQNSGQSLSGKRHDQKRPVDMYAQAQIAEGNQTSVQSASFMQQKGAINAYVQAKNGTDTTNETAKGMQGPCLVNVVHGGAGEVVRVDAQLSLEERIQDVGAASLTHEVRLCV
jgi:hypothetical protein